ncbi:MAG TPA: hypothetical protein VFC19_37895 [Candidatus Limnocylindrales bacterium]|nr:hypothetical protein [Candidatus Limnocylindrales bacterium]
MAGLAALLSFDSDRATAPTLEALSESLRPRGYEEAIAAVGPAKLLVRAALPKIDERHDVAMIVDGIAEPSNLFARYATYGPAGLLTGEQPYALIVADAEGAVLARNLDGPPLYYTRVRGAVLVASEPSALIEAGAPVAPNEEIVARFLDTGACDEVPATFFRGIRRVLPGQVVEVNGHTDGWAIRAHPAAFEFTFVRDLGEPAPGLADYLLWAMAKASGGEVDVLFCALGGSDRSGHLPRLADRVAVRYGVGLRFPFRELGGLDDAARAELQALAERTLPSASVRAASSPHSAEPHLGEILHGLRTEVATALLYPRHGEPDRASLSRLANLAAARRPELDRIWRHYLLERWLATVTPGKPNVPMARPAERRLDVAGQSWQRQAIRAEPLAAGDRFPDIFAWYTMEFVNAADRPTHQALRRQWLLVVAGKAVAVAQGEARAIWRIEPGRLARALVRLAGGRTRHPDPWSMRVAIQRAGRWRMCLAALSAFFKNLLWYQKIAGMAAMSVSPPREHACPPAHLAVVGPPQRPDQAANQVLGAVRRAVLEEIFDTLRGCAIVSTGGEGVRCLGWAGQGSMPVDVLERLCADNPLGQADERTPLMIAFSARTPARKPSQTGPHRAGKQAARRG